MSRRLGIIFDGVVPGSYSDLAVIALLSESGYFDVRDGDVCGSDVDFGYVVGEFTLLGSILMF